MVLEIAVQFWNLISLQTDENISQTSFPGLYFILTPVLEATCPRRCRSMHVCGGKWALPVAVISSYFYAWINIDIQIPMLERECSRFLLYLLGKWHTEYVIQNSIWVKCKSCCNFMRNTLEHFKYRHLIRWISSYCCVQPQMYLISVWPEKRSKVSNISVA